MKYDFKFSLKSQQFSLKLLNCSNLLNFAIWKKCALALNLAAKIKLDRESALVFSPWLPMDKKEFTGWCGVNRMFGSGDIALYCMGFIGAEVKVGLKDVDPLWRCHFTHYFVSLFTGIVWGCDIHHPQPCFFFILSDIYIYILVAKKWI